MSSRKTNAVRILERAGIACELIEYAVDEADLSAETVAKKIGLPPERVVKTLLVRGKKVGPFFALVPAGADLDLKALAKVVGDRAVDPVPLKEVEPLTGYIRGGVTALGAKRELPVVMEESTLGHETISVSAGMRGLQMLVAPQAYANVTRAKLGAISKVRAEE